MLYAKDLRAKLKSKALALVLSLLSEGSSQKPRVVGGCVRDFLLGLSPSDVDIATPLLPDEVMNRLQPHAKVIPTGATFGTVTAFLLNELFEITTLRRDVECYGRHAKVEFTNSFEEDARRRDFTINALSYCPFFNKVYDYFDGIQHLEEGRVAFIGEAAERIREDYLRIMRFFRFTSNYCKNEIDEQGYLACKQMREGLNKVSSERIKSELDKIISSKRATYSFAKMLDCNLFDILLPGLVLDVQMLERLLCLSASCSLELKYAAALYSNSLQLTGDVLKQKRFSSSFIRNTLSLMRFFNIKSSSEERLALCNSDWNLKECVVALGCSRGWQRKEIIHYLGKASDKFPIKGKDLVELGYKGKEIGEKLKELQLVWSKGITDKRQLLAALSTTQEK